MLADAILEHSKIILFGMQEKLEERYVIRPCVLQDLFCGSRRRGSGYQALYICTKQLAGGLYIKRGENSEEVNEYIKTVSAG